MKNPFQFYKLLNIFVNLVNLAALSSLSKSKDEVSLTDSEGTPWCIEISFDQRLEIAQITIISYLDLKIF
ncbi:hypothetical protein BpHYR1_026041 [Brachionus plicatilis]|uniref:Uncharacterized protein n=1 Tax=Brachionus plicatilis TaxID=10195 RepID=A0A3M7T036_BRAPC|nr:hypothetical protein BpHYR1_026041 [Brachionus plicatilis]